MAGVLFPGPDLGMILLPTMLFHQMQLMVCAVLARRWAQEGKPEAEAPPAGSRAAAWSGGGGEVRARTPDLAVLIFATARDPNKPNRRADAAQHRRFFDLRPIRQRRRGFGVARHVLRHDHLAAAALVFETRRDIHGGAEIVEHIARRDCDARSGMKAELQHDGGRAFASRGVEACDIVLDRERRADARDRDGRRRP